MPNINSLLAASSSRVGCRKSTPVRRASDFGKCCTTAPSEKSSRLSNSPLNPNGAVNNIAGICNERRNVVGLMPHPERACESPLGSADGLLLFESVVSALATTGPAYAGGSGGVSPKPSERWGREGGTA